jgi:hypothetical protein
MLAGALSAASNATSVSSLHAVAIVGEGSAPFPTMLTPNAPANDTVSFANHF